MFFSFPPCYQVRDWVEKKHTTSDPLSLPDCTHTHTLLFTCKRVLYTEVIVLAFYLEVFNNIYLWLAAHRLHDVRAYSLHLLSLFPFYYYFSDIWTSFFFLLLLLPSFSVLWWCSCGGIARDWSRQKIRRLEATVQSCWKTHTAHGRPSFLSIPVRSEKKKTSCFTVERIAHNTTHSTRTIHTKSRYHASSRCPSALLFPVGFERYISCTQRRHPTVTFSSLSTTRIRQSDSSPSRPQKKK